MSGTTRKKKTSFLLGTAAVAASIVGAPAAATADSPPPDSQNASGVETVIVTAQRRAERNQDVPITITALSATQLSQAGVNNLGDIAKLTPALRFDAAGAWAEPTIRGVGSALITSGSGSNVGIYVDGYYNPNELTANFQLLNIQNIQVLKGPQGTLFGHNTTGGAILVTTAKPSQEMSGMVDVSYGNYNAQRYEGYFTSGVTDHVAVDIAGIVSRGDGYDHDIVTGSNTDGAYQDWSIRAGVNVELTDNVSFLFHYQHTDTNDPSAFLYSAYVQNGVAQVPGAAYNLYPGIFPHGVYATKPHDVADGGTTGFTEKSDTVQLTGTFNLDFATLTSYSQFSKLSSYTTNYNLASSVANPAPGVYLPFFRINIPISDNQTITQELLLDSNSEGRLKWTAGAFYLNWREPFAAQLSIFGAPYFPTGNSGSDTISAAVYGNADYRLLDKLYLSAGLRYSYDAVENAFYHDFPGVGSAQLPTLKGYKLTPRAVVRYTPDNDSSVYFSFSRGYKSAIYNVGGASKKPVSPESITAYEVGYKYAHEGLSFDVESYYYDYSNLQVTNFITVDNVPESVVSNAATSRIYGFEGQAQYEVSPHFRVNAGAAYTDAKYVKYLGSPSYKQCLNLAACGQNFGFFNVVPTDLENSTMIRAPAVTANIGAVYTTDLAGGNLSLSGDLYYTSKVYFDSTDEYKQDGYALLDLRAEWTTPSGNFTFAVFGNNVTDVNYANQVFANTAGIGKVWGNPATYGAEVTARLQ